MSPHVAIAYGRGSSREAYHKSKACKNLSRSNKVKAVSLTVALLRGLKPCGHCMKEKPAEVAPELSWRERARRDMNRQQMQALNRVQWTPERRRQMSIVIQRVRAGVAA